MDFSISASRVFSLRTVCCNSMMAGVAGFQQLLEFRIIGFRTGRGDRQKGKGRDLQDFPSKAVDVHC